MSKILLLAALCSLSALSMRAQSELPYAPIVEEDTLRELIVRPDTVIRVGVNSNLKPQINNYNRYTLDGIMDRWAPTLKDQIMHPFGFAERKQSRRRKRADEVLRQYDAVRDPLQELLDSVARAKGYIPEKKKPVK